MGAGRIGDRHGHARSGYSIVSAIWNAAFGAGMGAGAIGMGLLAGHIGYPATFLLTAALVIPALIPARRDRLHHRLQLKAWEKHHRDQ